MNNNYGIEAPKEPRAEKVETVRDILCGIEGAHRATKELLDIITGALIDGTRKPIDGPKEDESLPMIEMLRQERACAVEILDMMHYLRERLW